MRDVHGHGRDPVHAVQKVDAGIADDPGQSDLFPERDRWRIEQLDLYISGQIGRYVRAGAREQDEGMVRGSPADGAYQGDGSTRGRGRVRGKETLSGNPDAHGGYEHLGGVRTKMAHSRRFRSYGRTGVRVGRFRRTPSLTR
jgi:hypothetical protein